MTKPTLGNSIGTFNDQDMMDLLQTDLSYSYSMNNDSNSVIVFKHPIPDVIQMCFEALKLFRTTRDIALPIAEAKQSTSIKYKGMYSIHLKDNCHFSMDRLISLLKYDFAQNLYYGLEIQAFLDVRNQVFTNNINYLKLELLQNVMSKTDAENGASLLNHFFKQFQTHVNSSAYKKKERNRRRIRNKNKKACIKLFNSILDRYAKTLVIRIDFSLKRDPNTLTQQFPLSDEVQSNHDLEYIRSCIKRFKENRRHHSVLKKIQGYIFQYEYSFKTDFHIHAYFFFNGNEHQEDISIAQLISDYWKKLTNNQGCTFICNMKKNQYKYNAIGMIHYSDKEKQQHLISTFDYICKADQFFVFSPLKHQKNFQCSQPLKQLSNAGRPRKHMVSTH